MHRLHPPPGGELSYQDLVRLYDFPATYRGRRVRANFISSVDGAAQGADQRSGTLSSAADRRLFALQRSLCDVIVVGASTTRVEGYRPVRPTEVDQALRSELGLAPLPAIAVVSRSLDVDAALLGSAEAPTVVLTSAAARADRRRRIEQHAPVIARGERDVDLAAALDELASRGYRRVLCEGGPTLMATLVAAQCLDELCLTISPVLVGGDRHRILHGADLVPPPRMRLAHLLGDGDDLFARYLVDSPG